MLLTEEQARTKWCPQSRVATSIEHQSSQGVGTANRGARTGIPYESCHCIASECMAWRWNAMPGEFPMKKTEAEALVLRDANFELAGPCKSTSTTNIMVRRIAATGYCGLAGPVED